MSDIVTYRHKEDSFDLISGLEACREWIENVTEEDFSSDDFHASTKDGILLCKLVNKISPGIINQVNTQNSVFSSRTNIEQFLGACKKIGLTDAQLFNVEDLYSNNKLRSVAVTIHWLAYVAEQMNLPNLPPFDPLHLSRISLPTDQKKKLNISPVPLASQSIQTSPQNITEKKPDVEPIPEPVSTTPTINEMDEMLKALETSPEYQIPNISNTPTNNNNFAEPMPTPSIPSYDSPVIERSTTPRAKNSPVVHRNAPPRWKDTPTPSSNNLNTPPVWTDSIVVDPNITNCDDCRREIYLGKTAFASGNRTFCRSCLCGTCGKAFHGTMKTNGGDGKNYCPDCVCKRCKKPITSQYVPDGNFKVCVDCACKFCRKPMQSFEIPPLCNNCKCSQCNVPLNGKYYPRDDGARCCESCIKLSNTSRNMPNNTQTKRCNRCNETLSGSVVECSGAHFHQKCFLCVDCNSNAIQLLSGNPYCGNCHPDKEQCCVCGFSLRGGGLEALGRLYHDKCFTCQRCFNPLPGGRFKEVDNFALCNNCAVYVASQQITHT